MSIAISGKAIESVYVAPNVVSNRVNLKNLENLKTLIIPSLSDVRLVRQYHRYDPKVELEEVVCNQPDFCLSVTM